MSVAGRPARILCLMATLLSTTQISAEEVASPSTPADVARAIDQRLNAHWTASDITPAELADDATFLRRTSLDLIGRIPTLEEYDEFFRDDESARRTSVVRRLLSSPEFAIHFARVLDGIIQDTKAGDDKFLTWVEQSLTTDKAWDAMFREIMLGPWKSDEAKSAIRFLDRRTKDLDALTVDSARAFFGVDISCARCHDHPLVEDWKQGHYYGMQAFFNRTTGGKGKISEKKDGEVTIVGMDGKEQTARPMFLSGEYFEPVVLSTVKDPPPESQQAVKEPTRRDQLVSLALRDDAFFRRSFVNRMWHWFFGRGLVDPVDQMHSRNAPSVPGLLEWLADDFADSGYDVRRLIESIVLTQAWQRDSRWVGDGPQPDAGAFAVARLRPLTRQQLAESLILAVAVPETSDSSESDNEPQTAGSEAWRRKLAERARPLLKSFDPKRSGFESGAGEALFLANSSEIHDLITAHELYNADTFAAHVFRRVLSRDPMPAELDQLKNFLQSENAATRKSILWALVSSAEFRFNH
jgi:hypothetical protein